MNIKFLGLTLHVEIPELVNALDRLDDKLDTLLATSASVSKEMTQMSAELDTLTAQVKATDDAEQSALVLINGIAARLAAAGTDPAALNALAADLKTNSDALAAAVTANTPAGPAA
jgi:chromosome segregation ATPase